MISELKITKYNSLEEFIAWTDSCPKDELNLRGSWSGANSYAEAVDIARKGKELQRAEQELKELQHTRQEMVQVMDVTGSVVNMDAYLSGVPENMMEFPIIEEATKFINLLIEVGENAYVSSQQMVNKAIAVASIVDDLENSGYRVGITVCDLNGFNKSYTTGSELNTYSSALVTAIKIKDYHQPLSIGQLIGCCYPSFLRGLIFAHFYGIFKRVGGPPSGKGRNLVGEDVRVVLKEISDPDTVYIPNSDTAGGNLSTVESALKMINKYLK